MRNQTDTEASARLLAEQFPILDDGLYFNHAAIGPWPRRAAEAVQDFACENMQHGSRHYRRWIAREAELRQGLARLLGAGSTDDIALLKNTTEGVSLVAWGLDWRPGDNMVLPRDEFASNHLPWLAQVSRGIEVREVNIRAAADAESALLEAMDRRTRLLSVSAVQWSDGFRLDLQALGQACRQREVLFFVDAIQQLGCLPLETEASGIDFLAADAHKWLLGPEGIAVFYCSESARPRLQLTQQGWHMFDNPWQFDRQDWSPASSARRFEAGSPNSTGQAALHASLGVLLEFGMDKVAARVLANTAYLLDRLRRMPEIRISSRGEKERRSGIVSFMHERLSARELHSGLARAGVTCAVRGRSIRLSPHFYQGEAQLDAFFEILNDLTGKRA